jgi:hypothetical protein
MGRSIRGVDLVEKTAQRMTLPTETVQQIMNIYFEELGKALNERYNIIIKSLGTMKVKDDDHGIPHINYAPSLDLIRRVTVRPEMNKYGVILDRNKVAAAKLSGKCPKCKTKLETIDPPKCAVCGTQPFEDEPLYEEGNG